MKFIKKALTVLGFSLLNTSVCFAAAESAKISAEIEYKPMDNTYIVSGAILNETRGNINVGLRVIYEDDGLPDYVTYVWTGTTVANKNDEGEILFAFEPVALKADAGSGDYTFELTSFVTAPNTVIKSYLTNPDKLALMKELDGLSGDLYTNKLVSDGAKLGADMSIFNNLSPVGKSKVSAKLQEIKSGLTNVTTSDPDYVTKTNTAVDRFITNYNEFSAIEAFNDCKTAAEVDAWMTKYADKYGIKTDRETVWNYYKNSDEVKTKTNELLVSFNSMTLMSDIKSKIYETIICSQFHFSHVLSVESLMTTHQTDIGLVMSSYNSLRDKTGVKNGMVGSGKFTYNDLKARFNELVNAQAEAEQNSGQTPGGGGGFGGSPISGISGNVETKPSTVTNPFVDLKDDHWAASYILKLYEKNIMNGKEDSKFEPETQITRAEIVKVIVEAYGLTGKSDKKFNDVPENAWYADYVAIALYNGIIEGDENGNFRPNDPVTRQELAVMLYRAMKISVNAPSASFADSSDIAGWANGAVNYLAAEGVINGYGDGTFKPYGNATRAETAKIIASILD